MNHVFFSDIDLIIDEDLKEILLNPKGERYAIEEEKDDARAE